MLQRLRRAIGPANGFPRPYELANALLLRVVDVPRLPIGCRQLTDGRTIWCAWDDDTRVRGTRLFEGIASAVIGAEQSTQSPAEVQTLAGRLAAPPLLMREVGLDQTIFLQPWATETFLRWWWGCGRN